ncbi:MAG: alpha/beta fold hydrolase [Chitinophagaceae bacterium]
MKSLKFVKYIYVAILLTSVISLPAQQIDTLERKKILVTSSLDGTTQPSYFYFPISLQPKKKIPLVVFLHTWSNDLEQRFKSLEVEVAKRGWLLLAPNFRGRNDQPEACGSRFAQQDVLDAVSWVKKNYAIDKHRVYLVGFSGGGYLTMLMAALHPKNWAAASAWCGISDIAKWYALHENDQYGKMMRQCFGGAPGQNDSITLQYRNRSPVTYLFKPGKVPLDLAAGRNDSVVPPIHSINAFNALIVASGYSKISNAEIDRVLRYDSINDREKPGIFITDSTLGRRIFLRKEEGKYRLTIYEGKHEWIPEAAMEWIGKYRKKRKIAGL